MCSPYIDVNCTCVRWMQVSDSDVDVEKSYSKMISYCIIVDRRARLKTEMLLPKVPFFQDRHQFLCFYFLA